jgi:uncharacterized membrane protein YgcG
MQSLSQKIKKAFWTIFLSIVFLLSISPPSLAVTVENVPLPQPTSQDFVIDLANILNSETKYRINLMVSKLRAKNGSQIAVVTVPETSSVETPLEFAKALFKRWTISNQGLNKKVLFLISPGDRRVEIRTSKSAQAILPDSRVREIIGQKIVPLFKQGDLKGGTLAGTEEIVNTLLDLKQVSLPDQKMTPLLVIALFFFVVSFVAFFGWVLTNWSYSRSPQSYRGRSSSSSSSDSGFYSSSYDSGYSGGDSGGGDCGGGDGGDW